MFADLNTLLGKALRNTAITITLFIVIKLFQNKSFQNFVNSQGN